MRPKPHTDLPSSLTPPRKGGQQQVERARGTRDPTWCCPHHPPSLSFFICKMGSISVTL